MVRYLDGQTGLAADGDGLLDGVQQFFGLVADVAHIDATVAGDHLRQRHHLVRLREGSGRVNEACRHAKCAGGHPFVDVGLHRGEFAGGWRAAIHPQAPRAHNAVRDEAANVEGGPGRLDCGHVLSESRPRGFRQRAEDQLDAWEAAAAAFEGRGDTGAAVTDDVGRDALEELEVHRRDEDGGVVVGVDVDEARRHGHAGGVDLGSGCAAFDGAYPGNAVAANGVGGAEAWGSCAVDDGAAADDDVVGFAHAGNASGKAKRVSNGLSTNCRLRTPYPEEARA